jgi:MSHA biogenesis protein MshL
VHNIEAREFFMGLVMDSKENIVVHPEVSGVLSLELKNVTLADVIEVVQKVYGYDCEKTDMGYIVYPATLHTRTFKVDHLDLLREGRSNTNVTSGQSNQQGYNNQQQQGNNSQVTGSTNQTGNTSAQSYNSSQNYQTSNSSSSIRTTSNSNFWKELDDALHAIIAVDPQASVTINQQSGMVVARAKPMQLHEIENFLTTTQNQISRQVILEAKIVEVILDNEHQDGVNWLVMAQNAELLTGFGTPNPAAFTAIFTKGDFTAMVKLLETQGKTNVLSSPKVSTLNNQNARANAQ